MYVGRLCSAMRTVRILDCCAQGLNPDCIVVGNLNTGSTIAVELWRNIKLVRRGNLRYI